MLKDLQPAVEEGIAGVAAARLPGILREKRPEWEKGIENLKLTGAKYNAAIEKNSDALLMDAAEDLHGRFAFLMGLIRPALKELDDFHSSLYMLYHYYLPEYDIEKIRSAAGELKEKMQALNTATLPESFQSSESDFQDSRKKLHESVEALSSIVGTGSKETVKKAIEELHTNYETLQEIFE
jgi:hypothetical protein